MSKLPGFRYYTKLHKYVVQRIIWPYSMDEDSLYRWRANILTYIVLATLFLGFFAYLGALNRIITEKAWILGIIDTLCIIFCLFLIFIPRIRFEIRTSIIIFGFYLVGVSVILSVGPVSGGPAWLFAFAVLSGVIIGNKAAFIAILMNILFMIALWGLFKMGYLADHFQVFNSLPVVLSTGSNFIVLNGITAVSVSALLNGVYKTYKKKEELANSLQDERSHLMETKKNLENEILERKTAEEEIWKLNQFKESVIDNVNIWLSVLDEEGNVVVWNKAAEKISGYSRQEVVGHRKVWEWGFPDAEYRKEILEKVYTIIEKNLEIEGFETTIKRSDGNERIISWNSRNILDANNNPTGSIAIGRDITEHKKAEEEKRKAQKVAEEHKELALVGQVAGKMAHDFNNVLGIIMGNAELGLMQYKDENIEYRLNLILDQTIRGKNLTKNLVAFAKSQDPQQEYFVVKEKVDFVLNLLKEDLEGIEIIREDNNDIPELLADPGMIEHALVNMIQNSIHATATKDHSKILIRTYGSLDNIYIEIEDNGCGIPEAHIDHIYIPSFTLKGGNDVTGSYEPGIKGTGYGMSNVRKYINQHNGEINVESKFGEYTKFTISLPVVSKEKGKEETVTQRGRKHYKKRILIVEDEIEISNVQKQILSAAPLHHMVDIAVNGKDAMELFESKQYDFVSLDYVLLGNINGMDVYKGIREINKTIPILFLSGNIEFLESIKKLKEKDKNLDHLSKPCQNKVFLNSINKLMDRSNP